MNLFLYRKMYADDGIHGTLMDSYNNVIAVTLERAEDSGHGDGSYAAKMQPGRYECIRGEHKLSNLVPFETFEIEEGPEHDNILFHAGNYNADSHGCVLLGEKLVEYGDKGMRMITNSKATFKKFMELQNGVDKFILTVINL